jgi:hypothetical protein
MDKQGDQRLAASSGRPAAPAPTPNRRAGANGISAVGQPRRSTCCYRVRARAAGVSATQQGLCDDRSTASTLTVKRSEPAAGMSQLADCISCSGYTGKLSSGPWSRSTVVTRPHRDGGGGCSGRKMHDERHVRTTITATFTVKARPGERRDSARASAIRRSPVRFAQRSRLARPEARWAAGDGERQTGLAMVARTGADLMMTTSAALEVWRRRAWDQRAARMGHRAVAGSCRPSSDGPTMSSENCLASCPCVRVRPML